MSSRGSLACVGAGMMLGAHIGARGRATIEQADVVFVLVADALFEGWIARMNRDVRSLQPYYGHGRLRSDSYERMVEAMLAEVRAGRKVCGVFYGHPGVFALVPHAAIARARAEGHRASMEPGVSAEDCLYADLGIDPGTVGCQHYEASQFMFCERVVDPAAWLVLWQVGIAGDRSLARFETGARHRALLVDKLLRTYPADHRVVLYEASTLPTETFRNDGVRLADLAGAEVGMATTLVIPPATRLKADAEMIRRVRMLEAALAASPAADCHGMPVAAGTAARSQVGMEQA